MEIDSVWCFVLATMPRARDQAAAPPGTDFSIDSQANSRTGGIHQEFVSSLKFITVIAGAGNNFRDWWQSTKRMLREFLYTADYSAKGFASRHISPEVHSMQASKLRLQVSVSGHVRANITFPASAAANLADLVPPDVSAQLSRQGIDAGEVAARVVANAFPIGDLFNLNSGEKQVRIWLE